MIAMFPLQVDSAFEGARKITSEEYQVGDYNIFIFFKKYVLILYIRPVIVLLCRDTRTTSGLERRWGKCV